MSESCENPPGGYYGPDRGPFDTCYDALVAARAELYEHELERKYLTSPVTWMNIQAAIDRFKVWPVREPPDPNAKGHG